MNSYFKAAMAISELSTYPRIHIGCVIVKGKSIISSGYNQEKTHPLQLRYNKYRSAEYKQDCSFIHAEMCALTSSCIYDLEGCEMYIYRHSPNNKKMLMARPCNGCMAAIQKRGCKTIHYTTPDGLATEKLL